MRRTNRESGGQMMRTVELRQMERYTCAQIMHTYDTIKSVMGNAQAIDYSRITEGQGPQFSTDTNKGLALLDFCIDVENTIKSVLTPEEQKFFLDNYSGHDLPIPVDTEFGMAIQEQLGRSFYGRGMYPVRKYFVTIKR